MSEEESIQYDVDEINMKREYAEWLDNLDEDEILYPEWTESNNSDI